MENNITFPKKILVYSLLAFSIILSFIFIELSSLGFSILLISKDIHFSPWFTRIFLTIISIAFLIWSRKKLFRSSIILFYFNSTIFTVMLLLISNLIMSLGDNLNKTDPISIESIKYLGGLAIPIWLGGNSFLFIFKLFLFYGKIISFFVLLAIAAWYIVNILIWLTVLAVILIKKWKHQKQLIN